MMGPPRGVVFDLDGTLVLSHHDFGRMREAILRVASKYGAPRESLVQPETLGTSATMASAHRALTKLDATGSTLARFEIECAQQIDTIEQEAVDRTVERAGAATLLRGQYAAEVQLGLFTRSSDAFCRAVLSKFGWTSLFSSVRTRSAPGPAKPSREALRRLLEKMGLEPPEVVYVEDHLEDARCSSDLGVTFYAVLPDPSSPTSFARGEFLALGSAGVVIDLHELVSRFSIPNSGPGGRT